MCYGAGRSQGMMPVPQLRGRATTRDRPYDVLRGRAITRDDTCPPATGPGDHKGSPLLCYAAACQGKSSLALGWSDDTALHFLSPWLVESEGAEMLGPVPLL